jgi:hypothetical protein
MVEVGAGQSERLKMLCDAPLNYRSDDIRIMSTARLQARFGGFAPEVVIKIPRFILRTCWRPLGSDLGLSRGSPIRRF